MIFWEINAKDGPSLAAFYDEVFDWQISADDSGFYTVRSGGERGINGGIFTGKGKLPTHRAVYVRVASVEDVIARVRTAGGEVIQEPFDGPGDERLAFFRDLEGHVVGVVGNPS